MRVLLGAFGKKDADKEEGFLQPEVDYTIPYKNYTWSNLLSDLKERVSWGDAQEFRATLHKQLRVGLDNDLVVMALDSGDFELHVEVVSKVHVCHVTTNIPTH